VARNDETVQILLAYLASCPILRLACKVAILYALHFDVPSEVSSVVPRPDFHK
jgi:hypothetical protein